VCVVINDIVFRVMLFKLPFLMKCCTFS